MAEKIGAWIRDPKDNLIKGMSKRAGLYELFCERPDTCDLLKKDNTCLNCSGMAPCRFGRKVGTEGPTRQARSFHSTLAKWKERNEGFLDRLQPLRAYNRVFKTHGHFYLPYAHMSKGVFGDGNPLKTQWVPEDEMTTELLARVCLAEPRAMMGGVIPWYQEKEVPKFIADLKTHYPEVFDLLPDSQKARLASVSYVGRRADLTTCAPGEYVFSRSKWEWDGDLLRGKSMLFQPVEGDIAITIKPKPGQPVEITDNAQVTENTSFLD